MKNLAKIYQSTDMYGSPYLTFTPSMDESAAVAVVELPEGYEVAPGNDRMMHVYGPGDTVYELDATTHNESYLCHPVANCDEYDEPYIVPKAMTLRSLRTRAGLTQVQLAERVGATQSQIADWERGRNVPSVQTCVRLADALGISRELVFDVCSLDVVIDDAASGVSDAAER